MQHIKLSFYHRPEIGSGYTNDKFYRVWLPENRSFYFGSKRETLRFLAELNKHLNAVAFDVNFLCGEIYSEFRTYFFHLSTIERNVIESSFSSINRLFGLLLTRSEGINGASFVYQHFRSILKILTEVLTLLVDHPVNAANTVQRYKLANLAARLQYLENQLEVFPEN